ncbi:MAG: hypothetical protein ACFE8A_00880 [Candidatus Hodarchaeota archaeon]
MTNQILTWLNGLSAFLLICSAWIMALLSLKFYFKTRHKRHINLFTFLAAIALGWTGITITFLSVAIYGRNLPWVKGVISYFSYSTIPFGAISIILFTWDVFGSPKSKKIIISGFLVLSIVYYIFLYTTFQQVVVCPDVPKGEIYDDWINQKTIFYYLLWVEVSFVAVITAIGFNRFRKMTAGDLKKRAGFIILAAFIVGPCILLDTVILGSVIRPHEHFLFIVRFLMIVGAFLAYWSMRPPT